MNESVLKWMASDDTGVSSKAIVMVMNRITPTRRWSLDHPHDPSDLGRCIRLLALIPEYRIRLDEMKIVSDTWSDLVTHWHELEELYYEELPSGRAPKCYARMREIIDRNRQ